MIPADTIARALKGRRCSAGWICRCPAHDDRHPSLSVTETNGKTLVHCLTGCKQGEVIDALRRCGLWSGRPSWPVKPWEKATQQARDPMRSWRNAASFTHGCAADRYLKERGLDLTKDEARSLRVSNALWHWPTQSRWPAMLARVALATGEELSAHQTFLTHDGEGKAPLGKRARLFPAGGRTAGGGVWFGVVDPDREFVVGEGIESTLSAMRIFGVSAGCAALSAFGIRTLVLPSQARRVRISTDHDEHGQGLAAAREAGRRWLAEGRAVAVSMAAEVGDDANDVWRKRLRSHG